MMLIYWTTAAASLLGVWLNIHHRPACFAIWAVTNGIWVVADITHGLLPQAVLQAAYLGLALYGLAHWRRRPCPEPDTAA